MHIHGSIAKRDVHGFEHGHLSLAASSSSPRSASSSYQYACCARTAVIRVRAVLIKPFYVLILCLTAKTAQSSHYHLALISMVRTNCADHLMFCGISYNLKQGKFSIWRRDLSRVSGKSSSFVTARLGKVLLLATKAGSFGLSDRSYPDQRSLA